MAFPLVGVVRNGAVFAPDPSIDPTLLTGYTRTWGASNPDVMFHNQSDEQSLFVPQDRNAAVFEEDLSPFDGIDVASIITRSWNGIGGVGYLPSFPQWDRKVTTFPMAH